jgi:hypothetical protein
MKKRAEDGLDDILRINASGQPLADPPAREGDQAVDILLDQ